MRREHVRPASFGCEAPRGREGGARRAVHGSRGLARALATLAIAVALSFLLGALAAG